MPCSCSQVEKCLGHSARSTWKTNLVFNTVVSYKVGLRCTLHPLQSHQTKLHRHPAGGRSQQTLLPWCDQALLRTIQQILLLHATFFLKRKIFKILFSANRFYYLSGVPTSACFARSSIMLPLSIAHAISPWFTRSDKLQKNLHNFLLLPKKWGFLHLLMEMW